MFDPKKVQLPPESRLDRFARGFRRPELVVPVLIVLLALLGAATVLLAAYFAAYRADPASFNADLGGRPRRLALLDAIAANLIVFSLLGIVTFVLTRVSPSTDGLFHRIGYLFSGKAAGSPGAMGYLKKQIDKLSAVGKSASYEIRLTHYADNPGRVSFRSRATTVYANLMKHDEHNEDFDLDLQGDEVGETMPLTLEHVTVDGELRFGRQVMEKGSTAFKRSVQLKIKPDGHVDYSYEFRSWNHCPGVMWFGSTRFCERVEVTFINETNLPISIRADLPEDSWYHKLQRKVIKPGDPYHFVIGPMIPQYDYKVLIEPAVELAQEADDQKTIAISEPSEPAPM